MLENNYLKYKNVLNASHALGKHVMYVLKFQREPAHMSEEPICMQSARGAHPSNFLICSQLSN